MGGSILNRANVAGACICPVSCGDLIYFWNPQLGPRYVCRAETF